MSTMDDRTYQHLADDALKKLESMFEDVDAEDVDIDRSGDVVTLTFKNGKKPERSFKAHSNHSKALSKSPNPV